MFGSGSDQSVINWPPRIRFRICYLFDKNNGIIFNVHKNGEVGPGSGFVINRPTGSGSVIRTYGTADRDPVRKNKNYPNTGLLKKT
jgi:hypothetical protein